MPKCLQAKGKRNVPENAGEVLVWHFQRYCTIMIRPTQRVCVIVNVPICADIYLENLHGVHISLRRSSVIYYHVFQDSCGPKCISGALKILYTGHRIIISNNISF